MLLRRLLPALFTCVALMLPAFAPAALAATGSVLAAAPAASPGVAPGASGPALDIATIMARDWIGTPPEEPYWADDGKAIYYRQRRPGSEVVDLHRVDIASGRTERIAPAELGRVDAPDGFLVARPQAQGLSPRRRSLRQGGRPQDPPPADPHRRQRERSARPRDGPERRLPARRCLSRHRPRERPRLDPRRPAHHEGPGRASRQRGLPRRPAAAPFRGPRRAPGPPGGAAGREPRQTCRGSDALAAAVLSRREARDPARRPLPFGTPSSGRPRQESAGASDRSGGRGTGQGRLDAGLRHRLRLRRREDDPPQGRDRLPRIADAAAARPAPPYAGHARPRPSCPASPTIRWPSCARRPRLRSQAPVTRVRRSPGRRPRQRRRRHRLPLRRRRRDRFVSLKSSGARTGPGSRCSSSPRTTRTAGSRSLPPPCLRPRRPRRLRRTRQVRRAQGRQGPRPPR